ncbi:hypothetical protein V8F20_001884 [Naviculisporaceae sp. PSN 640]
MVSPILPLHVRPITYQSGDNTFSEWITLFTLCLAPLIAHIIAGVPQVSCLAKRRPRWHDRICHYNPISILWRYAVIADRRIRAQRWDSADLAASNTLFWTPNGWDGSENMVEATLPCCARLPEHTRVSVFSGEMLKTIVVSLQGGQVVFIALGIFGMCDLDEGLSFASRMGLDFIFFPVALLGLMRVFACLWVTEDFSYTCSPIQRHQSAMGTYPHSLSSTRQSLDKDLESVGRGSNRRWSTDTIRKAPQLLPARFGHGLSPFSSSTWSSTLVQPRYRPTATWPSRIFRLIFFTLLLGLWTLGILIAIWSADLTATGLLTLLFYHILLGSVVLILSFYFVRGKTTTTIIPCISSTWYKIYTICLFALAITLFVVGCIETRQTPCGTYTSYPDYVGNIMGCFRTNSLPVRMGTEKFSEPFLVPSVGTWDIPVGFGIGFHSPILNSTNAFMMVNFTGTCLGNMSPDVTRMATFV